MAAHGVGTVQHQVSGFQVVGLAPGGNNGTACGHAVVISAFADEQVKPEHPDSPSGTKRSGGEYHQDEYQCKQHAHADSNAADNFFPGIYKKHLFCT